MVGALVASIRGACEALIGARLSTSLRRPINREGAATKRWARWHAKAKQEVLTRNMRLRFGLCDVSGCKNRYSDLAHLFGRGATGARLGEPWASLPELCLALCRDHHNALDRHAAPELLAELRWAGLRGLSVRFLPTNDPGRLWADYTYGLSDPIDAARRAVEELEKTYDFDPQTLQFTRKEAA